MVFSSPAFIFVFLPVTALLYFLMPKLRLKNAVLIAASLIFYAYGEPVYVFLMIASVLFNYIIGLFAAKKGILGRTALLTGAAADVACLGVFKYTDFIIDGLNRAAGLSIPLRGIALPIGISFFTFQEISYIADVYRSGKAQKSLFKTLLYISFFPQLIAGPIVKYSEIEDELSHRGFSADDSAEGVCRFIFGLSKKLLISNPLGLMADTLIASQNLNILSAWLFAISYSLQLYFDFSGYSDMAIGLGRIFGFHFNENFNYPYIAHSVKDFWRRWHISLSSWFRDYVYIPLGGSKKGSLRTCANLMLVFLLTGLWHGASLNFVVWGAFHGFLRILEYIKLINIKNRVLAQIYTLLAVCLGFVIFRAETLTQGLGIIKTMFFGFNLSSLGLSELLYVLNPFALTALSAAILLSFPLYKRLRAVRFPLSAGLFALCIYSAASSAYNPFIYFRF